jgi:hypothetical protein
MELSMRKLSIFFLLLLITPLSAVANDASAYWGLMVGQTELKAVGEKVTPTSFTGRLGVEFNKFLSVEGRLMASGDDTWPGDISTEVTYLGNASVKVNIPFGGVRRVNVYGLVGYSTWKFTSDDSGQTSTFTDNGPSYGGGIDLFADGINGLNFEWIRFGDEKDDAGVEYTLDTVSIGYVRRF